MQRDASSSPSDPADSDGFSTANKGNRLVSYHLEYSDDDSLEPHYSFTFSRIERAPSNLSKGQGNHSTSLALILNQLIELINYNFPSNVDELLRGEKSVEKLVGKIYELPGRQEFFLEEFFDESSNNPFLLGQFGKHGPLQAEISELIASINNDFKATNENIRNLIGTIEFIKKTHAPQEEKDLHIKNLKQAANHLKMEYNGRVVEKASRIVTGYLNKGFCVSFEKVPLMTKGDYQEHLKSTLSEAEYKNRIVSSDFDKEYDSMKKEEAKFNDDEPERIKSALAALDKGYTKNILDNNYIITNVVDLLTYPPVSQRYHEEAVAKYTEAFRRHMGQIKQPGRIGKVNKRTNDENMFCYVVANHIETAFTAFSWLNTLDDVRKEEIINGIIDKIITPDDRPQQFVWKFKNNQDVKNRIKVALTRRQEFKAKQVESGLGEGMEISVIGVTPYKASAASSMASSSFPIMSEIDMAPGEEFKSQDNVSSSSQTSDSSYSKEKMTTQSSANRSPIQSAMSSTSVSVSERQKLAEEKHKKRIAGASGDELSGRTGGQFGRGFMPGAATVRRQQQAKQSTTPPSSAVDAQRSTSATKNKPFKPGGGNGNADSSGSS